MASDANPHGLGMESVSPPERTTEGAHARIDGHIDVCAERYRNIERGLNEVKAMLMSQGTEFHGRLNTIQVDNSERLNSMSGDVNARLNTISSRMWAAMAGTLGTAVLGLAAVVFYLLTKGKA